MADAGADRNDKNKSLKSEIERKNCSTSNEANDADDRWERISPATGGDVRNRRGDRRCGASDQEAPAVSTREYAQAFRQWMWQYQLWTQAQASLTCTFPMNYLPMATTSYAHPLQTSGGAVPAVVNGPVFHGAALGQPFGPAPVAHTQPNAVNQRPLLIQGRECQLPALWKRVMAEFIDFFLLFVMKLAASIMVIEYIGVLDIEKYDIDQLLAQDWDSNLALSFTSDLIAMEIINRIFICLFETLCLRRGFAGSVGGTTPGKYLMRLRVISCQSVAQLPGNKVLIVPGNDIGLWNAFLRSIIKNFSLVFFFPVCLTVFFFPNSRTAYDIASCSVVVEVTPENAWAWPHRQN